MLLTTTRTRLNSVHALASLSATLTRCLWAVVLFALLAVWAWKMQAVSFMGVFAIFLAYMVFPVFSRPSVD